MACRQAKNPHIWRFSNRVNTDILKTTRHWTCPECHTKLDRDVNAALNIKAAGLAVLACGENVNPVLAKAGIG